MIINWLKDMESNKIIEKNFKISIERLFPKFNEHLDIENNSRILFSGKFGIGKTYFLNEFFENKKGDYEVFHLFPVNYQITSNENIIEFLKYDILIELLKKDKDIVQKNDYSNLIDLQRLLYIWGKDNFVEIFKTGVSIIPKLGKPLKEVVGLTENFWKFKKGIEAGGQGLVDNFLKEIKEKNILETDSLSELLKRKIKKQKGKKQSILILDDLERIDPEHIFRILNVFSAHLDSNNEEIPNKFNFDKIILVADIKNLRSIFHYRYGDQTDFNGYFNKFFSEEVFQFKNEEIIAEVMDEVISHFQIKNMKDIESALGINGFLRIILKDILLRSLELNGKEKLDLRQLLKGVKFQIPSFKNGSYERDSFSGRDQVIPQLINISIKVLISIFGGVEKDFISVLEEIKNNIKTLDDSTRGYDTFSFYLLKAISPLKDVDGRFGHEWNGYSIVIENKEIKNVAIIKNAGLAGKTETNIATLYFDLLIEYVVEKIYEKEIELW